MAYYETPVLTRDCKWCGKPLVFETSLQRRNKQYCDLDCQGQAASQRMKAKPKKRVPKTLHECVVCGSSFYGNASHPGNRVCRPLCQYRKNSARRLGVDPKEFHRVQEERPGACPGCGIKFSEDPRQICVDHNHTTGKVRGLLCVNCNCGIGNAKEDPEILRRWIAYLEEHNG